MLRMIRQAMPAISFLGFALIMLWFSISGAAEEPQAAERGDQRQPPAAPKWGDTNNGLRTRISAEKQSFRAGDPVSVKLEIENVGEQPRYYQTPAAPHNQVLIVTDEQGREVPYLGGLSQVQVRSEKLAPGQSRVMASFDLAEAYYLRQPGRYSVRWPGEMLLRRDTDDPTSPFASPASVPFEFDVTASPVAAKDGDPIGRLLPLVKKSWWLEGGSSHTTKLHPGSNRSEVNGRLVDFHYNPTGYKKDSGVVWLWIANEAADEQKPTADWPPQSESLGKIDRWHVYIHINTNAQKAWPTAADDIKRALSKAPPQPGEGARKTTWGELKNGMRARLVAERPVYDAGAPVPMTFEVRNESDIAKDYRIAPVDSNESLLSVVDSQGKSVPYLGGLSQLIDESNRIAPGDAIRSQPFDLASCYYLRRPGRYIVRFPGNPPSAEFELTVAPNRKLALADGDPVGRLLPLVRERWWLGAGAHQAKLRSGRNWQEVPGQIVRFVYNPPAHKADSGLIDICLCDRQAAELPANDLSSVPEAEYLGKFSRWHVYVLVSANAAIAWPTAETDIVQALAAEPQPAP